MQQVRKLAGTAAAPASIVAGVVGFITDVLQPLGDFAPWVAFLSFVCAVVSFVGFMRLRRKPGIDTFEQPLFGVLVFSTFFTVVFTLWSLVEADAPPRGIIADNVEPIAKLQAQLLGLQEDVTQIKQTTSASATTAAVAATAQAQGFKDIQSAFAALSGQGTIIQNPKTPQEWYANARLYQLKGDTANAIKAYEGYFTFKLEYVDPYDEYAALLKANEGIVRARQIVADMQRARPDSQALELLAAKLLDAPADRLARLVALTTRAPQFAPGFLELGLEYDRALLGNKTADLTKKQQDAYTTLFKMEEQQGLTRFYIDKVLADKKLADARTSLAVYANAGKLAAADVQMYFYAHGVQFLILLTEANVKQLFVGIDEPDPKTDIGKSSVGAMTFVNQSIGPVKVPVGDHVFYMRYIDANGTNSPVFSKPFRVDPIAINFQQQPPDLSSNTIPGVFTVGVVGAVTEELHTFNYSLDSDKLDQAQPAASMTAISFKGLTRGDHTLYIRATQTSSGKQTAVVKFAFTVK